MSEDSLTKFGAGLLAAAIEKFWHDRGHGNVKAQRYEIADHEGVYGVRSNLVNGKAPL